MEFRMLHSRWKFVPSRYQIDKCQLKLIFSKKATKIDKIFTVDLTFTTYRQIDGEDFIIFVAFLKNTNFNFEMFSCALVSSF